MSLTPCREFRVGADQSGTRCDRSNKVGAQHNGRKSRGGPQPQKPSKVARIGLPFDLNNRYRRQGHYNQSNLHLNHPLFFEKTGILYGRSLPPLISSQQQEPLHVNSFSVILFVSPFFLNLTAKYSGACTHNTVSTCHFLHQTMSGSLPWEYTFPTRYLAANFLS